MLVQSQKKSSVFSIRCSMLSIISVLKKNLVLSLLTLALSALPLTAQAGVGDSLGQSSDQNLFKFFGIDETTADASESRLVLRPETPYLSEVTQLRVRINADGNVERMELWMEGSFMEDEWVTAYDVAGWFLNSAVPQSDSRSVELFKLELQYPQDKGVEYINTTMPSDLPKQASRAYMAFRGDLDSYEQKLGTCTMRIENTQIGGKDWLRMIIVDESAPSITQLSRGPKYKI